MNNDAAERVRFALAAGLSLCADVGCEGCDRDRPVALENWKQALAAEREAGRREGLEEAAKEVESYINNGCLGECCVARREHAAEVRALAQKP